MFCTYSQEGENATSKNNHFKLIDDLVGAWVNSSNVAHLGEEPGWQRIPWSHCYALVLFSRSHTDLQIFSRHFCLKAEKKKAEEEGTQGTET